MHKLLSRTGAVITSATMLLATVGPASANVSVTGNGAFSNTQVAVSNSTSSTVSQTNSMNVTNSVNQSANTGGNGSSFNTGGGSSIVTGPAYNNAEIHTMGGTNMANLGTCGCNTGTSYVNVSGNGAFSHTSVHVMNNQSRSVYQNNYMNVVNTVRQDANSGNNSSSFNTGGYWVSGYWVPGYWMNGWWHTGYWVPGYWVNTGSGSSIMTGGTYNNAHIMTTGNHNVAY